jgi:hypothetical protein
VKAVVAEELEEWTDVIAMMVTTGGFTLLTVAVSTAKNVKYHKRT